MKKFDHRPNLPGHGTMEDYTTPFLVVFGVILWIGLVVIWGLYELLGAVLSAYLIERSLVRIQS